MSIPNSRAKPIIKVEIALAALAILLAVAGSNLAPQTPTTVILIYGFAGMVAIAVGVFLVAFVKFHLMQFVLRKGGTDTQWLWFPIGPKGLVQMRGRAVKYFSSFGKFRPRHFPWELHGVAP